MAETAIIEKNETAPLSGGGVLDDLFSVGAHYGYGKSRRHPSMKGMIFGAKNRVEIINIEKTNEYLLRALEAIRELGKAGKTLLFVGTKNEAKRIVRGAAESVNQPYVVERWVGGLFTNFEEVKKRIARLKELREKRESGGLDMYTKKERLLLQQEEERLEKLFGGVQDMGRLPDAIFIVDPKSEASAIREAKRMKIPIIALLNTDCDFASAEYPIPANDASLSSITFFVGKIAEAYMHQVKEG